MWKFNEIQEISLNSAFLANEIWSQQLRLHMTRWGQRNQRKKKFLSNVQNSMLLYPELTWKLTIVNLCEQILNN